jgi:hypothetical protein
MLTAHAFSTTSLSEEEKNVLPASAKSKPVRSISIMPSGTNFP